MYLLGRFSVLYDVEMIKFCLVANDFIDSAASLSKVKRMLELVVQPIYMLFDTVAQSPDTQIFSSRYPVTCKVYIRYHATNETELERGSFACAIDNPLAKARGLSLRTGGPTLLCLSQRKRKPCQNPNWLLVNP